MSCTHCGHDDSDGHFFCPKCGKLLDRDGLMSVGFKGFTGLASLNPDIERMWETGTPPG